MAIQPAPPKMTLRLVIHGRVQGVFFRDSMRREAQRLGVAGWVRNRSDGAVEAAVHGESASVDAIVRWARRGPECARVERVEIKPDESSYTNFEVIGWGHDAFPPSRTNGHGKYAAPHDEPAMHVSLTPTLW